MPFIGKLPDVGAFRLIDSITTSATDTYALQVEGLSYFPSSARNLIVSLNGVTQAPESAYTVSGSNIVFASALTASDVIDYILVIGESVDIGTPSDNTVGNAQLKSSLDFSGKTLTFSNDQISGDAINGGTATLDGLTVDTNTLYVDSTNNRVGIGTTPDTDVKLTVADSGTAFMRLRSTDAAGDAIFQLGNATDTNQARVVFLGADESLNFYTSDAKRVTITDTGNVGINTAQPVSLLDVRHTAPKITANSNSFASSGNGTGFGIYRSAYGRQAGYTWTIENAVQSGGSTSADYQIDSLVFKTRVNVTDSSLTDRVILQPSGNVEITDGNLVVANGHGISFSATGNISGTSSELLDDYEEGSFTADIRDGTNSVSIGTGYYTKVGNMVTCAINGYNQNISSLNTSHLRLGGLPFNASTNGVALGRVSCTNFETAFVQVISAQNYGFMYGSLLSGPNVKSLVKTDFASTTGASIWITISYRTA